MTLMDKFKLFAILLLAVISYQLITQEESVQVFYNNSEFNFEYILKEKDQDSSLPLLIFLHGNGDTPDNFFEGNFEELKKSFRILLFKAPYKCSIGLPTGTCWPYDKKEIPDYYGALNIAIKRLHQSFPSNGQKPVLVGYSGGAAAAYYLASNSPEDYSLIIPIAGKLAQILIPEKISSEVSTEIVAFHGRDDRVVEFHNGRLTVEAMQRKGSKIRLYEFAGGHHAVFKEQKKELYNLLLKNII